MPYNRFQAGEHMFMTVAWQSAKTNGEFRKTSFKAGEHTFMAVSLKQYLQPTKKFHQSPKKRTENAVKPDSKLANTRYAHLLATIPLIDAKKPPKCLKKNGECNKTSFKANKHTFLDLFWQMYLRSTQ